MTYKDAERLERRVEKAEEEYRTLDRKLECITPLLREIRWVQSTIDSAKQDNPLRIQISFSTYRVSIDTETPDERAWLLAVLQKEEARLLEKLEKIDADV